MIQRIKAQLGKAAGLVLIFTLICGVIYTLAVTGISQLLFPIQANGSMIEVDGKVYGSELLGQQYTDEAHMWGRIMNIEAATFTNDEGEMMMYAWAGNISPASDEYEALIAQRVEAIQAAHPQMKDQPIPVDLVTMSGSGLDPHISVAAAQYQASRLAENNNMTLTEIDAIIEACTEDKFLGFFGEGCVNVLKVNLMLDGILE